jgi:spore coat polysaccharide biosynthesis protein SpsF
MLKNLGIVQAWSPLPRFRANLARRFGGGSLLQWVIRRVTDSIRLDGVIVVAGDTEEDREIRRLVPSDVPVFFGRGKDALSRLCKAIEEYPAEGVVRVRGDNPFIDPGLIDRLIAAAEERADCDYLSYRARDGRPAIHSPIGVYAEWFRASALRKASRMTDAESEREHVSHYVHSHSDKFKLHLLPAPAGIDREDLRLTVDFEEDWDHALTLLEALGPERFDWQRIVELLNHQPALRSRMAALNRTHVEV